jgi:Tol biopolymer transport system component
VGYWSCSIASTCQLCCASPSKGGQSSLEAEPATPGQSLASMILRCAHGTPVKSGDIHGSEKDAKGGSCGKEVLTLAKRACTVLVWLLMAAVLASCGPGSTQQAPTATSEPTSEPGSTQPLADTPEASTVLPECQGRIAFVGRTDGERDISVIHADGSGLTKLTSGEGSPSWSPDAKRIAFVSDQDVNDSIYTINPDGSGLARLTDQTPREYTPSWSPDGKHVLFTSTRASAYGIPRTELFVVSAEGSEAVPLTDSAAHKTGPAWSPDGSQIAFTMLDTYNQGDVYVMAAPDDAGAGSGSPANLTQDPAHDCCVAWAPDSERILFLSSRNGKGAGLWLGRHGQGTQSKDVFIRAGEGSDLSAASEVVRPVTTVMPEKPNDVYVIDRDGGGLTRLTNEAGREKQASWSPDGRRIAFISDRDGNDEVYVMAVPDGTGAGGTEPIRLTDSPGDDSHPTWSPDGKCLAFVSRRGDAWELYVMNADGSGLRELMGSVGWGSAPSWAP